MKNFLLKYIILINFLIIIIKLIIIFLLIAFATKMEWYI